VLISLTSTKPLRLTWLRVVKSTDALQSTAQGARSLATLQPEMTFKSQLWASEMSRARVTFIKAHLTSVQLWLVLTMTGSETILSSSLDAVLKAAVLRVLLL
jgi:hypothetical protein